MDTLLPLVDDPAMAEKMTQVRDKAQQLSQDLMTIYHAAARELLVITK